MANLQWPKYGEKFDCPSTDPSTWMDRKFIYIYDMCIYDICIYAYMCIFMYICWICMKVTLKKEGHAVIYKTWMKLEGIK